MSFKIRSIYFTAAISAVLTVAAIASASYGMEHAKLTVTAHGPAGMTITGTSSNLHLTETDHDLRFTAYLNAIDTDNSMRNKHIQEKFKVVVKDHPDDLSVTVAVPKDKIDRAKGGKVQGTLTFHGVPHAVPIEYEVNGKHIHASFPFSVLDHGIEQKTICYAGVCADPKVKIEADFDLKD